MWSNLQIPFKICHHDKKIVHSGAPLACAYLYNYKHAFWILCNACKQHPPPYVFKTHGTNPLPLNERIKVVLACTKQWAGFPHWLNFLFMFFFSFLFFLAFLAWTLEKTLFLFWIFSFLVLFFFLFYFYPKSHSFWTQIFWIALWSFAKLRF